MKSRGVLERLLEDLTSDGTAPALSDSEFELRISSMSPQPLDVCGLRMAFDCLRGEETAIRKLKDMLETAAATLGRDLVPDSDLRAELCQRTYVRLLYGGPRDHRGYLRTYGGRAPLQVWLRTALVRSGLAQKRRREREIPLAVVVEDLSVDQDSTNPELELLKQRYTGEFHLAFRQSLASLSARDRLVLRYHLVDGLTAEQIGLRFRVHRVTVARWMSRIRRFLLEETKTLWGRMLPKEADGLDTIFGLIESRVHVSFALLGSGVAHGQESVRERPDRKLVSEAL